MTSWPVSLRIRQGRLELHVCGRVSSYGLLSLEDGASADQQGEGRRAAMTPPSAPTSLPYAH